MFKSKDLKGTGVFDTLLGAATSLEGNIESDGVIRIDGRIKGDIKTKGDVFIGSSASITGNIYGNNVNLAGKVEGNIYAKGILRILSTANLNGDISVSSFVADEGAIFQGKCSMTEVKLSNPSV